MAEGPCEHLEGLRFLAKLATFLRLSSKVLELESFFTGFCEMALGSARTPAKASAFGKVLSF